VADILLEGTANVTAPVAMESSPVQDKMPSKAPIISQRPSRM
jgi:hypothetical protein